MWPESAEKGIAGRRNSTRNMERRVGGALQAGGRRKNGAQVLGAVCFSGGAEQPAAGENGRGSGDFQLQRFAQWRDQILHADSRGIPLSISTAHLAARVCEGPALRVV